MSEQEDGCLMIEIRVIQEGPERFLATIAEGWWMAIRTTEKDSVKAVLALFDREMGFTSGKAMKV